MRVRDAGDGTVVLVGVAHDHPASRHRVRALVDRLDPDAVALELPPVLVPLFEAYARADGPAGGEMADAVACADDAAVAGIDAPTPRSLWLLGVELLRRRAAPATVRRASAAALRSVRHAVRGRCSLLTGSWRESSGVGPTQTYGCSTADSPATQAADEREHLRRTTALVRSLGAPAETRALDAARERHMAERLRGLADAGSVVAVVGYAHLDAVADGIGAP